MLLILLSLFILEEKEMLVKNDSAAALSSFTTNMTFGCGPALLRSAGFIRSYFK